jgi:hypothetical protein
MDAAMIAGSKQIRVGIRSRSSEYGTSGRLKIMSAFVELIQLHTLAKQKFFFEGSVMLL